MATAPAAQAPASVAGELLAWYDRHRRDLPWRAKPGEHPDAYAVWLSEIMLQQTTVRAVMPYYTRFLTRWPRVTDLAAASLDAIMQAWAGLGYYSRARNLHACAIAVARAHGGRFPESEVALRALPGIGAYTAAAIAAIAFGRQATVVDGNVERVMARLHAVETPLPKARAQLYGLMAEATPAARAGDFAQAMMDLGSSVCTPKSPTCILCPLRHRCAGAARGLQAALPRRLPKGPAVYRHGTAYYVRNEAGAILLRTRPPRGLLGGMVEMPGTDWSLCTADCLPPLAGDAGIVAGRVTHVFTHFTLLLDVVVLADHNRLDAADISGCRWVASERIDEEALSTLTTRAIASGAAAYLSKGARHQGDGST